MRTDYTVAEIAPRRRSTHRIALATALCVVSAAALMSRETNAKRQTPPASDLLPTATWSIDRAAAYELALQSAVADPIAIPEASDWISVEVKKGQALSNIFATQNLAPEEWMDLLKLGGDTLQLTRLRVGDELQLRTKGDRLEELRYPLDELRMLSVRRSPDGGFEADTLTAALERRPLGTGGFITSSLFVDGQKAGLTDRTIMEMAEMFGYDIDFAMELRRGDRFSVIYEELYKDGRKLRQGDILAAEFVNRGRVLRAVRHVDAQGHAAYYTPEGQSLKKAFKRTPLDFARISSPFNPNRRHPILNTIRAHKGVDYAAGSGTPIKAVGDGKVEFIGAKGGYGKVIVLRHGSQYTTLYAHMSRYRPGLKVGSRVEQGQVIGYVGATGLATAPHLHYEFRINGVHVNPVTVPLPRANPIDPAQLAQFRAQTAQYVARLDELSQTQVAQLSISGTN